MHPRQYLIVVFGVAAVLVGTVMAVNARVDPYGIATRSSGGANVAVEESARPGAFWRKALSVKHAMPRTVILGTSRAEAGIDPFNRAFGPEQAPVLNLSLGALSIDQIRLLLVHANTASPLRLAIIGLDLESFLDSGRPDFDPSALVGNPESEPERLVRLRIDVSREALSGSLATALDRRADDAAPVDRGGALSDQTLRDFQGQRGVIWAAEFANFYGRLPLLFPKGPSVARWDADRRRAAAMTSFRQLLQYARAHGIELRLFISPVHARYLEWYRRVGWWPLFEEWKRAMVVAVDESSEIAHGKPALELWDFSGFHAVSTEPVPRIGDLSTRMRWYRDTSHYSKEAGNLVLDRILGVSSQAPEGMAAARISGATIELHLAEVRAGAAQFRVSQPGEAANVGEMLAYVRGIARR